MAKVYMPNALILAAQKIKEEHPLTRTGRRVMSDPELRALLARIEATPDGQMSALAMTLTADENDALASYFPGNRFQKDLYKVAKVLSLNMDPTMFGILFDGWQQFPLSLPLIDLLAENDVPGKRAANCPLPVGEIAKWHGKTYDTVISQVTAFVLKGYRGGRFAATYYDKGFTPNRLLGVLCASDYLAKGRKATFQNEADAFICGCIKDNPLQRLADAVCLNMLEQFSSDREKLNQYQGVFSLMQSRFGAPNSGKFPQNHPLALETYRWWYNYRQLVEGFSSDADFRRVTFWKQFMGQCMVSRIRQSRFLVMEFREYVAVESEVVGFLYIFRKSYFNETVRTVLLTYSESAAKRWMRTVSDSRYSKMHSGYWENDVSYNMKLLHMI